MEVNFTYITLPTDMNDNRNHTRAYFTNILNTFVSVSGSELKRYTDVKVSMATTLPFKQNLGISYKITDKLT